MYSVDTSTLMDWQARFYPIDVFPGLKTRIENLINARRFQAVALVKDEINSVGTPGMKSWAASQSGLFVPVDTEIQAVAKDIQRRYPDLVDVNTPHEQADPYVIALAKKKKWTVVSQETSVKEKHKARKKYFIPDVCGYLEIPCINLLGLIRKEGWTF